MPWDFAPELDWRSGIPSFGTDSDGLRREAERVAKLLKNRSNARYLYLPAPIPPVMSTPAQTVALHKSITNRARSLGAELLAEPAFSIESYLMSGCPIGGQFLGLVAETIIDRALSPGTPTDHEPAQESAATDDEAALENDKPKTEACKVLVTDLDNVLWAGGIAEEGLAGIKFAPESGGYKHFLYQTLLRKLKQEGTILAAVSRNDLGAVLPAFDAGRMALGETDFVAIVASYHAKSAQIRQLVSELNLSLSACVFVDDNTIELEEVKSQLPEVSCIRFPDRDGDLPEFFDRIVAHFPKATLTAEDSDRTELYRRRLTTLVPSDAQGADLTSYLQSLQMELQIHDRSRGDRARAVQLINKTNQFNSNGQRLSDEEVGEILDRGGHLYTASLTDRSGSHGEILACLLESDGTVRSIVMSCRVFQRHVEYAFVGWLAMHQPVSRFVFKATERNEPFCQFLKDRAFAEAENGLVAFDAAAFARCHQSDLELMAVTAQTRAPN